MVYHLIKVSTGGITFGDFMDFLSVLSKGSQRDKVTRDLSKERKFSADRLGLYYWHGRVKVWTGEVLGSVVATSDPPSFSFANKYCSSDPLDVQLLRCQPRRVH